VTTTAPAERRPQLLQQHLGDEVVAVPAHLADDSGERLGDVRGERQGRRRCHQDAPRALLDGDPGGDERPPEGERRGRGGTDRGLRAVPAAVGDQGRERRALADQIRGLPARPRAARVVVALVREDGAADALDAGGAHLAREDREIAGAQRRVAVPLQDEVAVPDTRALVEAPEPEDVGAEAIARPEQGQRRVGDRKLLVRGRQQRELLVAGEDDAARGKVDGERGGLALVDVRHRERLREPGRQRHPLLRAGRPGGERRGDQQQWDECGKKMSRPAHEVPRAPLDNR
jgi:hypothetical protein